MIIFQLYWMCLIFEDNIMIHLYFFYILHILILFLEKKYLFFIIFLIFVALYNMFFSFLLFNKSYLCVDFYFR